MPIKSEAIDALVAGKLTSGEAIVARALGNERSIFSVLLGPIGNFFIKKQALIATNARLLVVEYSGGFLRLKYKGHISFEWSQLSDVRLGWGFFNKKLALRINDRNRSFLMGRFWTKNNFGGAMQLVNQWRGARGLNGPAILELRSAS